jgi:hypothetical protein
MTGSRGMTAFAAMLVLAALAVSPVEAHGVSSKDARYLLSLDGAAVVPLMYLGAKRHPGR